MLGLLVVTLVTGFVPAEARPPWRDAPPRIAQGPPPREGRERPRPDDIAISPRQAASIAASRTGGRVLDVRLVGGNRPRYRVRILLGGERVRNVSVDAVTGEFRG